MHKKHINATSKNRLLKGRFYTVILLTMYELTQKRQFKHCQATITRWTNNEDGDVVRVFYSYNCPEIVKTRDGIFKFTFENSRKSWCITWSTTTSKQCNAFLRSINADITNHWDLPTVNLADFEERYFHTGVNTY